MYFLSSPSLYWEGDVYSPISSDKGTIKKDILKPLTFEHLLPFFKEEKFEGYRNLIKGQTDNPLALEFLEYLSDFCSLNSKGKVLGICLTNTKVMLCPVFNLHCITVAFAFGIEPLIVAKKGEIGFWRLYDKITEKLSTQEEVELLFFRSFRKGLHRLLKKGQDA